MTAPPTVTQHETDNAMGWLTPPDGLPLSRDEVHVWRASLDQPASVVERLRNTLDGAERARAARFHFEKDRVRFVVARGALRAILGRYLRVLPARLQFQYSPYGKPSLGAEFAGSGLDFNVSHSHSLALFAFARGRALGVDVERLRAGAADQQIAERFFSEYEVSALCGLPAARQPRAFFDCWTRKEAYIKATGEGLSFPLAEFDVSLLPDEPAALLRVRGDACEAERWDLRALDVAPDYAAALAAEGRGWRLKTWQWEAD
jgi:4'-phosphopantetheinyl transferase